MDVVEADVVSDDEEQQQDLFSCCLTVFFFLLLLLLLFFFFFFGSCNYRADRQTVASGNADASFFVYSGNLRSRSVI